MFFKEFIKPPLITVGSNPASTKIFDIKDVVVVFPCEPAITIFFFKATMFANISPLLKIGNFFFFEATSSLLFFLTAEEITIIVALFKFF